MPLEPEGESAEKRIGQFRIPQFTTDWDRLLNIYNIHELPVLPADGDVGSEDVPLGVKVLREFFLDAANAHASEIWFDFAPEADDYIDACFTPIGKSTTALRIPRRLFFEADEELGIFGFLLDQLCEDGTFAIHVSEFRSRPAVQDPFDKRGRIKQPPIPPDSPVPQPPEPEFPGVTETVTIRAFRVSLKGRAVPDDLVIQICPRFWHMPTGFTIE